MRGTESASVVFYTRDGTPPILYFMKPPYLGTDNLEDCDETKALERGVRLRAVCERAKAPGPETLGRTRFFSAAGMEIRWADSLPNKLVVIDGRVTIIPLLPPLNQENFTVLVVHHTSLTKMIAAAFESYWERAIPFEDGVALADARTKL